MAAATFFLLLLPALLLSSAASAQKPGSEDQIAMRVEGLAVAGTAASASASASASAAAAAQRDASALDGLVPLTFDPLPLGSITPGGWLRGELEAEAAGLAGHEYDFYAWVRDSSWMGGGEEYSGLNEGFPYWFNGLVPLAYALSNARLKSQIHSAAQVVLDRQSPDGWIGPETGTSRTFWARYPFLLGLTNLADANATWEQPVVTAIHKFSGLMHDMLADNYTGYFHHDGDALDPGDFQWGRVRYQDMLISLMWLYEKHPDGQGQVLLDNMHFLHNGSLSFQAWFNAAAYVRQDLYDVPTSVTADNYHYLHGVNVAQGLKEAAVARRLTGNESLMGTASDGVDWTMQYHGAASGTILADEREDGLNPYYGSELCTAVEAVFSLSYLYQALGDPKYADLAELATFNAMPAMLTGDWWAHQYMEQPNQPYATHLSQSPFYNTNAWGQTFGLEPNYPCCTVNHPQGLPKFLMATYVTLGDGGLVHALLSPASVVTTLSGGGGDVRIDCETDYPFSNNLTYSITSDRAFDFYVRVPSWYLPSSSSVTIGSETSQPLSPDTNGLHHLSIPAGTNKVSYSLGSQIRTTARANDTIAVYNGALLYALEVGSTNTSTPPKAYSNQSQYPKGYAPPQALDYQIMNTTAWNYAVDRRSLRFEPGGSDDEALLEPVFAAGAPPMYIEAQACQIEWPLFKGSVPGSAPAVGDRKCLGVVESVRLVPYGSAKLHMAELPTIDLSSQESASSS